MKTRFEVKGKAGRPVLLFLILLLHVALFLMAARFHPPVMPKEALQKERITYLAFIPPPRVQAPPAPAVPRQRAAPAPPRSRTVQPPVAITTPSPQAAAPVAAAAPTPAPDPAPPAHHLSGYEILEQAKADMPRIERELRNNVPTKLALDKNSMRYKLEHGIEDAYVGGDQRVTVDFYTSPDNFHYMRYTRQGKSWCTMHGGPVSLASAMGHGGGDSKVNCPPPDAGWKDMPWVN